MIANAILTVLNNTGWKYLYGKRVLCICESPFQMLGLLCIALHLHSVEDSRTELYVMVNPSFPNANSISLQVSNAGFFRVVECAGSRLYDASKHLGTKWLLNRRFSSSLARSMQDAFSFLRDEEYDVLLCSSVTPMSLVAKKFFVPQGFTVFFDDGSGSHNGNVFKPFACQDDVLSRHSKSMSSKEKTKRVIKRLVSKIPFVDSRYDIKALLLFSPTKDDAAVYSGIEIGTIPLPKKSGFASSILSPDISLERYHNLKWIFLSTSRTASAKVRDAEVKLACSLSQQIGDCFAIRLHPNRDVDDFKSCLHALLPSDDLWECLLLDGVITDKTCLIGYGSSCQLHPNSLCGLEPTVIFLYDVLSNTVDDVAPSLRLSAETLKKRYKNKERVSIPSCYSELLEIMESS